MTAILQRGPTVSLFFPLAAPAFADGDGTTALQWPLGTFRNPLSASPGHGHNSGHCLGSSVARPRPARPQHCRQKKGALVQTQPRTAHASRAPLLRGSTRVGLEYVRIQAGEYRAERHGPEVIERLIPLCTVGQKPV